MEKEEANTAAPLKPFISKKRLLKKQEREFAIESSRGKVWQFHSKALQ